MNSLQVTQFIVSDVHSNGEEESRVSSVNELVGIVFNKVCVLLVAGCHETVYFGLNARLFSFGGGGATGLLRRWGHIPF